MSIEAIEIESMGVSDEPDPEDTRSSIDKSQTINEMKMVETSCYESNDVEVQKQT